MDLDHDFFSLGDLEGHDYQENHDDADADGSPERLIADLANVTGENHDLAIPVQNPAQQDAIQEYSTDKLVEEQGEEQEEQEEHITRGDILSDNEDDDEQSELEPSTKARQTSPDELDEQETDETRNDYDYDYASSPSTPTQRIQLNVPEIPLEIRMEYVSVHSEIVESVVEELAPNEGRVEYRVEFTDGREELVGRHSCLVRSIACFTRICLLWLYASRGLLILRSDILP